MNRQYRRVLPLLTAAALAATPMEALAENPQFAHDEATWERLKDNVMEYDELSLLVEEYNPNYQNEQASYNDTKNDDDAAQIRRDAKDSAQDMYDSAEDLKEQAEDLSSMADDLSDQPRRLWMPEIRLLLHSFRQVPPATWQGMRLSCQRQP